MNDLRDDPNAHAPDKRDPTWFAASDTATVRVVAARNLRTVPFRDPRYAADCRTADDKMRAEFVRLVDALQALRLQFDVLIEEQARTITALEAYIHDHSEAEE